MSSRGLLVLFVLVFLSSVGNSEPHTIKVQSPKEKVEKKANKRPSDGTLEILDALLPKLDSDDFGEREKAYQRLIQHGKPMIAAIKIRLGEAQSAEVRKHLQNALATLVGPFAKKMSHFEMLGRLEKSLEKKLRKPINELTALMDFSEEDRKALFKLTDEIGDIIEELQAMSELFNENTSAMSDAQKAKFFEKHFAKTFFEKRKKIILNHRAQRAVLNAHLKALGYRKTGVNWGRTDVGVAPFNFSLRVPTDTYERPGTKVEAKVGYYEFNIKIPSKEVKMEELLAESKTKRKTTIQKQRISPFLNLLLLSFTGNLGMEWEFQKNDDDKLRWYTEAPLLGQVILSNGFKDFKNFPINEEQKSLFPYELDPSGSKDE